MIGQTPRYPYFRTDWAWEFLRRNEQFRAAARPAGPGLVPIVAGSVTRYPNATHDPRAEAWGLTTFR